jgi:hypothetical protein
MALLVVLVNIAAGLGLGAVVLHILGLDKEITPGEHWTLSFAIGFGVLGWLVFPIGISGLLSTGPLWTFLFASSLGILLLCNGGFPIFRKTPDAIGKVLLILFTVILFFDLAEALAPPADADSLAYHFNWPKRFVAAGAISFIPQAWTGAVPLLVQMTYIPPLALGGEVALSLWVMASSWAGVAMVFVFSRRHLTMNWSLAIALIYLTTPAVVYGGGSGQVESKMTLFVLAGVWSLSRSLETGRLPFAVLAGLAAGFFAGAKYLGLLFVAAAGLVLLFQRGGFRPALLAGIAFSFAVMAGGFQWYAWNAIHTGDPVFPLFFEWLGRDDLAFWSEDYSVWFKKTLRFLERDVPRSLWWLIGYPFKATFDPLPLFEARRTGFGPFLMLILPFSILGAWYLRYRLRESRLFIYAIVCFLFYTLWFFTGSSQRIRHLLPMLPLFLVVLAVAAVRFADLKTLQAPLFAAVGLSLLVQFVGHGVFSLAYLKHLVDNNGPAAFLTRNVLIYDVVPWINANLGPKDRLFLSERQILYYLKVPYFFGSPNVQGLVELRPSRVQPNTLYRQLRSIGVTHALFRYSAKSSSSLEKMPWVFLRKTGCMTTQKKFQLRVFDSRSLPDLRRDTSEIEIFRFNDQNCP